MVTILREDKIVAGGVSINNHLILAAGILGTTGASLNRMLSNGAGAVVTKSIGPAPKEGHKGPCVYVMDGAVINAMGLPNPSSGFVEELEVLRGKPVIASIFGGNPDEFALVASWFKDKVRGFELNVSCPHAEGYGAQIGCNPDLVCECTRAVAKTGSIILWLPLFINALYLTLK